MPVCSHTWVSFTKKRRQQRDEIPEGRRIERQPVPRPVYIFMDQCLSRVHGLFYRQIRMCAKGVMRVGRLKPAADTHGDLKCLLMDLCIDI